MSMQLESKTMNKIEQLSLVAANQANMNHDVYFNDVVLNEWKTAFAELIIKECMNTISSLEVPVLESFTDWDLGYNKAIRTASKVISKRFKD
jgi:hypothetical protein